MNYLPKYTYTDGVRMMECEACNGDGEIYCPSCGQAEGECETCSGSGEVEAPEDTDKE